MKNLFWMLLAFSTLSNSAFADYYCKVSLLQEGKLVGTLHSNVPNQGRAEGTLAKNVVEEKKSIGGRTKRLVELSLEGLMSDGHIKASFKKRNYDQKRILIYTETQNLTVGITTIEGDGDFNFDRQIGGWTVQGKCEHTAASLR